MQRVHGLNDLLALLAQADGPLEVQSELGAGASLGALYCRRMIEQAQQAYPQKPLTVWVDCADRAGVVLEALRVGLTHMIVTVPEEVFVKLADIATQSGAQLRRR